jgi:zinc-binding alcohol dehydrogenase/oxidoreductase
MKAVVHEGQAGINGLSYREMEEPKVGETEVKVKLKAAGLNRRDIMVLTRHKEDQPPLIVGSDGAGVIEEVGSGVSNFNVGDEVIINPSLGWKEKSAVPPKGFEIVGLPDHGTFAQKIVLPVDNVEEKPAHLSWEEASVLSLAAITAYRVLFTRGNVTAGDTVMIPGIGSGVATFLLLFAKKVGARVIVTSRSEEKQKKALELGADIAIDTYSDWNKELKDEKVSLLIESIGRATFNKSINIIERGGTIVTFGATTEDEVNIDMRQFFYGQYNLLGSTMGSREEMHEMLAFIEKHEIKPIVDKTFLPEDFEEAFHYLKESQNFGKITFSFTS